MALTMIAVAADAQVPSAEGVRITLEAAQPKVRASEPVMIRFTLQNTSAAPISVLKWNTPLEGFNSDMFEVIQGGRRVPYVGRVVKRANPEAGDYATIEPGAAASADVNLAEAYALRDAGGVEVRFQADLLDVATGRSQAAASRKQMRAVYGVRSNTVLIEAVEARPGPALPPAPTLTPSTAETAKTASAKAPAFKNCSSTQQTTLATVHTNAAQLAAGSILALAFTSDPKRATAQRYKSWFGAYTASRYATVLDHYQKIHGAYANQTVTFNCDCDSSYYAYVYKNRPYEIWLCKAFWSAPMMGTDSKAGTVVHETSHFTVVADTDDHAYGQANCRTLASNNPANAVDNADSHEYFAENTPAEKMGLERLVLTLAVVAATLGLGLMWRRRQSAA
jgi:peptidyl-Lys metalloendopeptidase